MEELAVEEVALHGHAATDIKDGRALFAVDEAAERALRRKIDIRILPTVALLYLCVELLPSLCGCCLLSQTLTDSSSSSQVLLHRSVSLRDGSRLLERRRNAAGLDPPRLAPHFS